MIEEVAELLGARRVLLVLEDVDGPRVAGAQLPDGEDAATLLAAIEPWFDEARALRNSCLRHGPEGADPIDQRSCIVAPLLVNRELLGVLYADLEGLFGRFRDSDHHLLATLAAQAAVALANLRTQDGLERQVAERTAALEQRAAELAIINAVQQALAGEITLQGVYQAVSGKLREVFGTATASVRLLDRETGLLHVVSLTADEEHLTPAPYPLSGFSAEVVRTGKSLLINEDLEGVSARLAEAPQCRDAWPMRSDRYCWRRSGAAPT